MKKQLTFLLILLISIYAFSQETQYEDVIYLKNGSVIRGMIIEQIPDSTLKIQTPNKSVLMFKYDEIQKIAKEEIFQQTEPKSQTGQQLSGEIPSYIKERGFEATIDILSGYEFHYAEAVIGIQANFGYRIIPQIYVGSGLGVERYLDLEETHMPIFFTFRFDFINSRITPFFSTNIGYAVAWIDDFEVDNYGGFMIEPGIGVRFNFSKNFGMNISTTFKYQKLTGSFYTYNYYNHNIYYWEIDDNFNVLVFKIGFSF